MTITSGTRLGPYEILGPLGSGGMGEVYRARDSRLSREVALKVLPGEVSGDRGRLSRFEKEARAASALNHPNIVTIYDMGSADSTFYIAMERVEGSTLRNVLVGGPLPVKKLLQVATQIADGLAGAHEAGIVHRDLKPENVMVTKDGLVKILDFGLAKLTRPTSGSDEAVDLPSETRTSPGVVVGTASYMSPEQASGEAVDFRSDQFAFGSILYEMAAGKRAFQKKTGVDTLAAILNEEPEPIGAINAAVPAPVRWIVERCHAKESEDRYAATRDLARELASMRDHLSEASTSGAFGVAPVPRRLVQRWQLPAAVALLAGVGIGVALRPQREEARFKRLTFRRGHVESARFAPDGQTIFYSASFEERPTQIFSTRVDSAESTTLPLPSAEILSISSSGKMAIALTGPSALTLAEVSLAGGAPRQILEANSLWADWSPDGQLALGIGRQPFANGRLEFPPGRVLFERAGDALVDTRFSPDGKAIAFISWSDDDRIMLFDLATKKARVLSTGLQFARGLAWHPKTGEVWFSARDVAAVDAFFPIYAVSPQGRRRVAARAPGNMLIQDISRDGRVLFTDTDFTRSMKYLPPGSSREIDLSWLDRSNSVDLSDDGSMVLFDEIAGAYGARGAVYVRKTDGSPAVRLGEGRAAALSPDGKWALSISARGDQLVLLPTGPGEPRILPGTGLAYETADFFPDGTRVLFRARSFGRPNRLFLQALAGGDPRPLGSEGLRIGPVSPDGRWIALRDQDDRMVLFPVEAGKPRAVPEVGADEKVLQWDATGEALFVMKTGVPARIDRLVLASGRREFAREIPAGGGRLEGVQLTPDGQSCVYTSSTDLSHLWLADGLR